MLTRQFVNGVITFLPGCRDYKSKGTGGTGSARYCYSIWLRHMVMADRNGLNPNPRIIAELGPGDSLGIGLAALLSGAERYYALDVVRHADVRRNLSILDELVDLFRDRAGIPDRTEFPEAKPYLEEYSFPRFLDGGRLEASLRDERIRMIRSSIEDPDSPDSLVQYKVPWFEKGVVREKSVDLIFSQAVLEHVDSLESTYTSMREWLRPGGYISHQIDFKCHETARTWNGHWGYSDAMWKLIRGRRPYLINREPFSTHAALLAKTGFKIASVVPVKMESPLVKHRLAPRFRNMTDEDLTTSGVFFQATRL